jgi:hypothetical protein
MAARERPIFDDGDNRVGHQGYVNRCAIQESKALPPSGGWFALKLKIFAMGLFLAVRGLFSAG